MPAKPRWLLAIPDAISQLEKLDRTLLTRRDIERLFGVSTARAATLMQTFGAEMTGYQRTLPRTKLLRQLRKHRARSAFRGEEERRERLLTGLRKARLTGIRVTLPAETLDAKLASLPEGVSVSRDRIEVRFNGAKEAVERLYALAYALVNDYERFEGARRRGRRQGRGVRMSEALVPAAAEPAVVADGEADVVLPALIVDAGPDAVQRFLEFFAGRIANARTRAAYGRAVGQFLAWCEARGLGLGAIAPLHVAAYIRTHPGSVPTVKQHLAAIRVLCDWLVVSQVLPVNPAAAVRGPKHVVTKGATPGPDPGRGEEAPRAHRHGHAGRAPRPGALLGDALQLRAGERGWGCGGRTTSSRGAGGGSGSTRRAGRGMTSRPTTGQRRHWTSTSRRPRSRSRKRRSSRAWSRRRARDGRQKRLLRRNGGATTRCPAELVANAVLGNPPEVGPQ